MTPADKTITMLQSVRLLAMDVDGVLTDGTLTFDEVGGEQKNFHVADGMGLTALRLANIQVAWISGRSSAAVSRRAAELKITVLRQGVRDKGRALTDIATQLAVDREATAFVGDDWNDLMAFEAAGVRIAVANADPRVIGAADLVTMRTGGQGAIREVCDALLHAQNRTDGVLARYLGSLKESQADGSSGQ